MVAETQQTHKGQVWTVSAMEAELHQILRPYQMGKQDAYDGMDYQPSSYYTRTREMRQYTHGYLDVAPDDPSALAMVATWDAEDEEQGQITFPWRR